MKIKRLIRQLEIDEGHSLRVYEDSLGYKTVGIGHFIKDSDSDEIKNLKKGDRITEKQCYDLFIKDLVTAVEDTIIVFQDVWLSFPDEAQEVFVNMMFNLGRTRFLKFKKTIAAAYELDWPTVAIEMIDSRWANQVGNRAARLCAKIRSL